MGGGAAGTGAGGPGRDVLGATGREEAYGPIHTFVGESRYEPSGSAEPNVPTQPGGDAPELVVIASGNLGMVYFAREPGPLTAEKIEARYPGCSRGSPPTPGSGSWSSARTAAAPSSSGPPGCGCWTVWPP